MLDIFRIIFILSKWKICSFLPKKYIPGPLYIFLIILEFIIANRKNSKSYNFGFAISNALKEMGPIYIKLGQSLSSRPDLIGHDIANSLIFLQDKLPPFSSDIALGIIEQELGKKSDEIFVSFDKNPIAAASIAQVHKAVTTSGKLVAVKILRPNIEQEYEKNIATLYKLSSILEYFIPEQYKRFRSKELIDVFHESMKLELNFLMEGSSLSEMKQNFHGDEKIHIPEIYWNLSSKRVMTTSWVEGVSIYETDKIINLGFEPKVLSKNLATIFLAQSYRDGFFHADLHPGNIFITKEGKIALIDFGIMGRLSDKDRFAIAEIFHAIFRRDYLEVAKIHIRAGYVPLETDIFLFSQHCRSFCEPISNLPLKEISIGLVLEKLLAMAVEFKMLPQHQLFLLQKTMIVLEGIGKSLYPDINMWELSEPFIKKWAAQNISPEARLLRAAKKIISDLINVV